jgi:hypothetical protein
MTSRWGKPSHGRAAVWPWLYTGIACDMAQGSNSVLPFTRPHATRHLIELFRGIIVISVDMWNEDHCRNWRDKEPSVFCISSAFMEWYWQDRWWFWPKIGHFLVFGGSWIQCRSIMSVMLHTKTSMRDLRLSQRCWSRFRYSGMWHPVDW